MGEPPATTAAGADQTYYEHSGANELTMLHRRNSPEICRRHHAQFVPRDRHDEDIERLAYFEHTSDAASPIRRHPTLRSWYNRERW